MLGRGFVRPGQHPLRSLHVGGRQGRAVRREDRRVGGLPREMAWVESSRGTLRVGQHGLGILRQRLLLRGKEGWVGGVLEAGLRDFPENVAIPPGPYSAISAGGYICGVRTDGSIACWGQQYDPGEIPDGPFASVSVGISQACGVKTDGSVRCWGDDSAGQAYSPPGTFVAVSGSGSGRFSCGLKADGSAMCWGTTLPR